MRRADIRRFRDREGTVRRGLDKATIPAISTPAGPDSSMHGEGVGTPDNNLATITLAISTGVNGGILANIGHGSVADSRILALKIAAHQGRAAASIAGDINFAGIEQADLFTQHLNGAALLAGIDALGLQGAAVGDNTCIPADQTDSAVTGVNGVGLDNARVVDHIGKDILGRLAGQQHLAAIRRYGSGVGYRVFRADRVLQDIAAHREAEQTVAIEIKDRCPARGQIDGTFGAHDNALIADAAAHQSDTAAGGSLDQAAVNNSTASRSSGIAEAKRPAQHEILHIGIEGRGDKTADIDLGSLAKDQAVGVGEKDPAIGLDGTEDLTRVLIKNPVKDRGRGRRLDKPYHVTGCKIEGPPVDGHVLALLVHEGLGGAGLLDAAGAANDRAPLWTGKSQAGSQYAGRNQRQALADSAGQGRSGLIRRPPLLHLNNALHGLLYAS